MKINNKITDVLSLYFWMSILEKKLLISRIVFMLFLTTFLYSILSSDKMSPFILGWIGFSGSMAVVLAFDFVLIILTLVLCYMKGSFRPSKVTIEDRGVLEEIGGGKRGIHWEEIKNILISPNHIFIIFGPFYKREAIVLPRRCFVNEQDFYAYFISIIKKNRNEPR